jgi:sporulation protein YlmC with PRC-barrel domain
MTDAANWRVLSTSTLTGDEVVNRAGESLGKIEDLMLDLDRGRVAYAVLSFGGFLNMGNKLFAVPWDALEIDMPNKRFRLDVTKDKLETAPGFAATLHRTDPDSYRQFRTSAGCGAAADGTLVGCTAAEDCRDQPRSITCLRRA